MLALAALTARMVSPSDASGPFLRVDVSVPTLVERSDDLRRLYEAHAEFVRRVVARLGGPHADVEDLVHDVFLVAWKRLDSFEGRSAETTWLFGIALRVVAAARRRASVRRFLGIGEVEPVDRRTPASAFEHREASRELYRILDRMAERKRAVFILYELEGLPGEEIATIVGCPLKTVWTRLHHARKEFARQVGLREARERREAGGAP
jgi:RNA polymerase sigma-70 factor (ECF subfamily)